MKKTLLLVLFASLLAFTAPAPATAQVAKKVTESIRDAAKDDNNNGTAASAEEQSKKDEPAENKKQQAVRDAKKPVEDEAGKARAAKNDGAEHANENDDKTATEVVDQGTTKGDAVNTSDETAARHMDKSDGDTTGTDKAAAAPAAGEKTEGDKAPAEGTKAKTACDEVPEPPKQQWPHHGIFGKYDMASVQRGFQVYKEVCSACHSMKFMSYRDLSGLGYTPDQVKAVAAEVTVTDGPNDDGEMFDRPARPSDHFKSPFANDKAARAANSGALPPDMSLLVKAREHGEDYIYAVLTGYTDPPACASMNPGKQWNKYFPPHQISMPKPLADGQVSFSDGAPNALPDEARDIVQFLAYASEPHMEARKFMGIKVVLFLLVFAGIMRAVKRKVWAGVH